MKPIRLWLIASALTVSGTNASDCFCERYAVAIADFNSSSRARAMLP
jgi:hypothetical protein